MIAIYYLNVVNQVIDNALSLDIIQDSIEQDSTLDEIVIGVGWFEPANQTIDSILT